MKFFFFFSKRYIHIHNESTKKKVFLDREITRDCPNMEFNEELS